MGMQTENEHFRSASADGIAVSHQGQMAILGHLGGRSRSGIGRASSKTSGAVTALAGGRKKRRKKEKEPTEHACSF